MIRTMSTPFGSSAVRRGFSLAESIVMLTVLAATSAVIVPAVAGMLGSAKHARVLQELNAIAAGMAEFCRDAGFYPGLGPDSAGVSVVLTTEAELPDLDDDESPWLDACFLKLETYLLTSDATPVGRWRGPYLTEGVSADPWGSAYVVNVGSSLPGGFLNANKAAIYVISAGPNGIIETPFHQLAGHARIGGDDLAVRLQ